VLAELMVLEGDPEHREQIERFYSVLDAQLLLGEAYLTHGRAELAIIELKALLRNLPTSHRAAVGLAVAYGKAGELDAGVEIYRDSIKIRSTPVIWSEGVSELYRRWAADRRDDDDAQFEAASVLYFQGRFQEALEMLLATGSQTHAIRDLILKIRTTLAQIPVPTE
jgi:tetratricopeptide (TPR) repeat protein